jgi:hypothetical protein
MKRSMLVILVAALVSGCSPSVSGTPQPEPTKLDCDLIFPGPNGR